MANDLTNEKPERRGPLPTGEYEHRPGTSVKPKSTEVELSTINRAPHLRHGRYDYEVEIVRDGTFYEGFVSQVRKGDAFQFMQGIGTGRWFGALSAVKQMPGDTRINGVPDPVFQFDGLEILQAAPTFVYPQIPAPKHTLMLTGELGELYSSEDVPGTDVVDTYKHRRTTKPDDAEDVEFKDQP